MKLNAVTSANGRIRKLFVFDTQQYELQSGDSETELFAPVFENYKRMAADLNKVHPEHPIEVCVFFRFNPHGPKAASWHDKEHNIHYIPVNAEDLSSSVTTSWTQDVLNIPKEGELYVNEDGFDPTMLALIKQHSGAQTFGSFSTICDGGNLQRGHHKEGKINYEYIIKSWYKDGGCQEWEISRRTGVKERNIFNVAEKEDEVTDKAALFHADMYCTVVGRGSRFREVVLIAEPYQENHWHALRKALDGLKTRLEDITTDMPSKFDCVKLPMVVFNRKNDPAKITYVLSYNNCLVENYVQGKLRFINFYFPDFLYEVQTSGEQSEVKKEALDNMKMTVKKNGVIAPTAFIPHDPAQFGVAHIKTVQDKIERDILAHFSKIKNVVCRVVFVSHNYQALSHKHGGLHCIAKVIERDLL